MEEAEKEVFTSAAGLTRDEQRDLIEALLFASGNPVTLDKLSEATGLETELVALLVSELEAREDGAFEIVQASHGYQLRTRNVFGSFIRRFREEKPRRLSAPALETLAIIAYRQPVVKSDVEKIRGVDCTPTIKTLLDRNLITIVGHQQSVGTPALYATSDEFLRIFGLKSLADLPTLRDLAMFEREPGEEKKAQEREAEVNDTSSNTEAAL